MRRNLAIAVVAVICSVTAGAWAFNEVTNQAGAAPPPPSATQVREQNLDGSGFIRVHEQGTANVNVTNGSLPVSGTVNVGNFPAAVEGRLIELGTQTGATVEFPLADVSDCSRISIFARHESGGTLTVPPTMNASPNGTALVQVTLTGVSNTGAGTSSMVDILTTLPFLSVRANVANGVGDVTAWIWCEP